MDCWPTDVELSRDGGDGRSIRPCLLDCEYFSPFRIGWLDFLIRRRHRFNQWTDQDGGGQVWRECAFMKIP